MSPLGKSSGLGVTSTILGRVYLVAIADSQNLAIKAISSESAKTRLTFNEASCSDPEY